MSTSFLEKLTLFYIYILITRFLLCSDDVITYEWNSLIW